MLRDESSCDGGSIVEKLESFVQGKDHNACLLVKYAYDNYLKKMLVLWLVTVEENILLSK